MFSFLNVLLALFGCFCFYNKARLSSVGPFVFVFKSSVFKFSIWLKVLLDDINNHLISVLVMNLWFKICGVIEGTIGRWVHCGEQQYSGCGDQTEIQSLTLTAPSAALTSSWMCECLLCYWAKPLHSRQKQRWNNSKKRESQYLLWPSLFLNTAWTVVGTLSCDFFK